MKKTLIISLSIIMVLPFAISCLADGMYYTDRDREMERKYLKSKLETAEKNYWAIPDGERQKYKYSFDRYYNMVEDKIHLLTWDPEQYFFEKYHDERASAKKVIIQNE